MADSQTESKTVSSEEEEGWDRRFGKGGHSAVGGGVSEKKDPRPKYNIISWLFFLWVEPFLWHSFKHGVTKEDLYPRPSEADSQKLLEKFNYYWQGELERMKVGKKPRLLLTMIRCILWPFLVQGLFFLIELTVQVIQSVVLGYLAGSITDNSDTSTTNAYLFAMGLVACGAVISVVHAHNFLLAYKLGMISRIIMTGVVYQKVTTLSQVSIGKLSIGHIVNLASNDVQRFDLAFLFVHIVWIAPIHLIVVTYLVYAEVGWSAFLVTGFVLLQVPLQILISKVFSRYRFRSALMTDKRIRIMNEIISGMKVIKMYAWELAFKAAVSKLRRKESLIILKGGLVRAFGLAFMIVSVTIMTFLVFSVYTATGGILSPKKVFTVLSLLLILRLTSVHFLVQNSLAMSEGFVAISRINKLLSVDCLVSSQDDRAGDTCTMEKSVCVESMSASWTDAPILQNISFKVDDNCPLLAVVGSVGAGKSTLLQVLLSELQPSSGRVNINGRLSYTSQEPWLFSASLRDNILFGNEYDPVRYNAVIDACALKKDIIQLVNDDLTLVGERGVTLSGGQKARVSLARAIYHQADIYLLDDPLSAVDTAVAKHLFDRCIRGFLRNSLVILVTHQVQFALQSDQVLGLKEGKVEVYGNVRDLLSRNINLKQLLGIIETEEEDAVSTAQAPSSSFGDQQLIPRSPLAVIFKRADSTDATIPKIVLETTENYSGPNSQTQYMTPGIPRRRKDPVKILIDADYINHDLEPSIFSSPSLYSLHSEISVHQETAKEEAPVIILPPEEKSAGSISLAAYGKYFLAGGNVFVLLLLLLFLIFGEGSLVLADWWISDWSQCYSQNSTQVQNRSTCLLSTEERIATFAGTLGGVLLLNFCKTVLFFSICINASRVLHNRMFRCVLRTPMLFFDTNPIGRILNRFSKDVGFLDDLLPYFFCEFVLLSSRVSAILLTAVVALPWLLIPCVVLFILFVGVRWYYLKAARDLKRLEGVARSPVYSHISSTLQGLPIIRSFGKTGVSMKQFHDYQNEHTKAYYLYLVLTRWLGIRMDFLNTLLLALVSFLAVLFAEVFDPALISLAVTYIISLSGLFQYTVRISADIENIMVSAERINEYSKLENEASLETIPASNKPTKEWPARGSISFENVTFRYSPDLPLVLNNLNFTIKQAEKIGVVGRTGAGKSSLLSVLFRLCEPSGRITIDGVDILSIGLHDVRSKMSIIPQDPVLFSGTMRYNIDPFNEFSDNELWDVLEQVQLKSTVQQLEGQLAGEVSEGGSNFSVGQKQLVCLARAMMRKNKILILDEATANVDIRTDEIIQQAIRQEFNDCTVITIAHRLNTIMDSDRILVLSSGEVLEFDTPFHLLQDRNSLLSEMVRKTDAETAQKLRQIAVNAHTKNLI
ncbi:ATP-binding cassette sub-family C member 4-like [Halichondria panicea]|uniref:ATP-binding cassette sub-family C member 4-like n=1 Tax=Halichondria panicea TaxID=6063 RepID=UPI00312B92F6